jgi:hypothetical protein
MLRKELIPARFAAEVIFLVGTPSRHSLGRKDIGPTLGVLDQVSGALVR